MIVVIKAGDGYEICPACQGTGTDAHGHQCRKCDGTGMIEARVNQHNQKETE